MSINLRLPEVPQTTDKELYDELLKVYTAIRALYSHAVVGGNLLYGTAGETISSGQLVGIKADGKWYKAQDGVVLCAGFCTLTGTTLEIQTSGIYRPASGTPLTVGSVYYNSNVAGTPGLLATAPTWGQKVGIAISASEILFKPQF